ncbi:MAG: arginine deiminase-related protein [Flavobacteriaceae bacterium]|nr:arginine deiminase-related protein [Flavobacteriaceae bacterium]
MAQITNNILMVRPAGFRMNPQTTVNNYFQKPSNADADANQLAQLEFDVFVEKLQAAGVHIMVVQDMKEPDTPDALFPNNWISFHQSGDVGLYPMFAQNRRLERNEEVLQLLEKDGFLINEIVDYTSAEEEGLYLEGTGSMVLDRENRFAYCALSDRADEDLFIEFCEDFEYHPILFSASQEVDGELKPVYHTNVMMCVADQYAVICLESIKNGKERRGVIKALHNTGKEIITINELQMHHFAGNMLQVKNDQGKALLIMSTAAFKSLSAIQKERLEVFNPIVHSNLKTIETNGGGSARCMMAEVFLPKKL